MNLKKRIQVLEVFRGKRKRYGLGRDTPELNTLITVGGCQHRSVGTERETVVTFRSSVESLQRLTGVRFPEIDRPGQRCRCQKTSILIKS